MKVEFHCQQCRSVLRLEASHQGKNVRCPVCGSITLVSGNFVTVQTPAAASELPEQPLMAEPVTFGPSSGSTPSPTTNFDWPRPTAPKSQTYDNYWWAGLVFGILSIFGNMFFCFCCFGPPISFLAAFACCTATFFSVSGPKWVNFLLAGMGVLGALIWIAIGLLA